jgi:hypothetical protein
VKAGVIEDITTPVNNGWRERFNPRRWNSTRSTTSLRRADATSQVGFFYNKDLFAKAGVDGNAIKTWADLLAAVKKLQAAGITCVDRRRRRQSGRCISTGRTLRSASGASRRSTPRCAARARASPAKPSCAPARCSRSLPT